MQSQFHLHLSCLMAEAVFKGTLTTREVVHEYFKSRHQQIPHSLEMIDPDILFKEIVQNLETLQEIKQSNKSIMNVLQKIPGFNWQIKSIFFRQKLSKHIYQASTAQDSKEELVLREGVRPQTIMVHFIIGFDLAIPWSQMEAIEGTAGKGERSDFGRQS